MTWRLLLLLAITASPAIMVAQTPGAQTAGAQPSGASELSTDPLAAAAEAYIGRATILRGFPGGGDLHFDPAGRLEGATRPTDWTLAGFDLENVTRHNDQLLLDGLRVAIAYNPGNHTFERHPLKDQHIRMTLPVDTNAAVQAALRAMFSVGIDPALQRSMPPYWSHYFSPGLPWTGADELAGVPIAPAPGGRLPDGSAAPIAEKKVDPDYTTQAREAKIRGTVSLRTIVGPEGVPRRITIRQPLGWGLDAQAAEALSRWHFRPGLVDGKPAALELIVNQQFDFAAPPAR